MKRTKIWYVLMLTSLVFTLACERNASSKSRITLQLPQELQERMDASKVSAFTTIELRHLALQVSAPDINPPIQIVIDHGNNAALPASVSVDIPSGDNRLIQVLAGYSSNNSDSAYVYYGDVTQAVSGSSQAVAVDIYKLGGTGVSSVMSRVMGRYLTSTTSGPNGIINMIYRPPGGKPPMPVDKTPMLGGWFEVSVFKDIPMDFRLDTGLVLGLQWTSASFTPSQQVLRVTMPSGFESFWQSTGNTYRARDAEENVFGFFAADPSFIADKKVCVTPSTDLGGGTLHSHRSLSAQDPLTARPIKYFASGTTPTYSSSYITMEGGLNRTSCGTLLPHEEFSNYLWFLPPTGSQALHNDFAQILGLREGFSDYLVTDSQTAAINHMNYRPVYSATHGLHYLAKVLPGFETGIDGINVYIRNSLMSYGDNRCDRLATSGAWTLQKKLSPIFVGNQLILKAADLPPNTNGYGLCMTMGGKPMGRVMELYGSNFAPANGISLSTPIPHPPHPNECRRLSVNLTTTTAGVSPYNPYNAVSTTVSATQPVLYNNVLCSGTGVASLTTSIHSPEHNVVVFYKATAVGSIDFSISSVTPSFTIGSLLSLSVINEGTTLDHFELKYGGTKHSYELNGLSLPADGCFPLSLTAKSSTNDTVSYSGSVSLSLLDLAGTLVTPAGIGFYDSCSATTPLSGGYLTFSSADSKTFAIKTSGAPVKDLQLRIYASAIEKLVGLNVSPLADKLVWHHASAPNDLNLLTGMCTPVTLVAKDSSDAAKNLAANATFQLNSNNPDVMFFTDSGCASASVNSVTMLAGTSQVSLFIKTLQVGSFSAHAHSMLIPNSGPLNIISTASAMTLSNVPGVIAPSGFMSIEINGGGAPYNLTTPVHVQSYSLQKVGSRYYFDVFVSSSATGTVSFNIHDSTGQVLPVTVNVSPP